MRSRRHGMARGVHQGLWGFVLVLTVSLPSPLIAATVAIPHQFSNGAMADANEVNANFTVLADGVNDNDSRIQALEDTIQTLQATLVAAMDVITALQSGQSTAQSNIAALHEKSPCSFWRGTSIAKSGSAAESSTASSSSRRASSTFSRSFSFTSTPDPMAHRRIDFEERIPLQPARQPTCFAHPSS